LAIRKNKKATLGSMLTTVDARLRAMERRPSAKRIKPRYITAALIDPDNAADIRDTVSASGTIISSTTPDNEQFNPGDTWLKANTDGQYEEKVYAPTSGDATPFDAWKPLVNEAGAAALTAANAASLAANNSNRVFYQTSAPGNPSTVPNPNGTGTVSYSLRNSDLWFDTDDGNKPYKWVSATSLWVEATFGDGAIAGLNAGKITVGTLGAQVVYAGTVAADKILAGTMAAGVIAGRSVIADSVAAENITGSTITGKTIRTSSGGSRVELSTDDRVSFYRDGTFIGALQQTNETVGGDPNENPTGATVIRLQSGTGLEGPRLILSLGDSSNTKGAYLYSDDAGDDFASQNYIATTRDSSGTRTSTVFSPNIELLGDQTYITAVGTASSEDPDLQAGVLTLAGGRIQMFANALDPTEIKDVDGERYYALGYDNNLSDIVLVSGGTGGTGTAGYFNGQSSSTLNNKIYYNNSSTYPSSARAGDILIWYT